MHSLWCLADLMAGPRSIPVFTDTSRDRLGMLQQQPGQLVCMGAPSPGPPGPPGFLPFQHPLFPRLPQRFDGDDDDMGPFGGGGMHSPFRVVAAQHHHERVLAAAALRRHGMNPAQEPMPPLLPNAFIHSGPGPGLRPGPLDWDGGELVRGIDDAGRLRHQQPLVGLPRGGEFLRGIPNRFTPKMSLNDVSQDVQQPEFSRSHGRHSHAVTPLFDEARGPTSRPFQHTPEAPPHVPDRPPGFEILKPPGFELEEPPGTEKNPSDFEHINPPGTECPHPPGLEPSNPPGFELPNPPGFKTSIPPGLEIPNPPVLKTSTPPGLEIPNPPRYEHPPGFELPNPPGFSGDQVSRRLEGGHADKVSNYETERGPQERTGDEDEGGAGWRKLAKLNNRVHASSTTATRSICKVAKQVDSSLIAESKPECVKESKDADDEPEEGQLTPPTSPAKVQEHRAEFGGSQFKERRSNFSSSREELPELADDRTSPSHNDNGFSSIVEPAPKSRSASTRECGLAKFDDFQASIRESRIPTVDKFRTSARATGLLKVGKLRKFSSSRELSLSNRDHFSSVRYRDKERGLPRIEGETVTRVDSFSSGLPGVHRKGLRGDSIDFRPSKSVEIDCDSSKYRNEQDYGDSKYKGERDYDGVDYGRSQTLEVRRGFSPPANSRSNRFGSMRIDSPSTDRVSFNPNRRLQQPQGRKTSSENEDRLSGEMTIFIQRGGHRAMTVDDSRDTSVDRGASPISVGKERKLSKRFRVITDHLKSGALGRDRSGVLKRKGYDGQSSTTFQDKSISDFQDGGKSPLQKKLKTSLRSQERTSTSSHQVKDENLALSDRYESESEPEQEPRRHPAIFARLSGFRSERSPPHISDNSREDNHRFPSSARSLPLVERKSPSLPQDKHSFPSRARSLPSVERKSPPLPQGNHRFPSSARSLPSVERKSPPLPQGNHRFPSSARSLPSVERKSPSLPHRISSFKTTQGSMLKPKGISASVRIPESTYEIEERQVNLFGARRISLEVAPTKLDFQDRLDSQDKRGFVKESSNLKREDLSSKRRLELSDGGRAHLSRNLSSTLSSGMEGPSKELFDSKHSKHSELAVADKPDSEYLHSRGTLAFREPRTTSQYYAEGKVVKSLPKIISTGHKKDYVPIKGSGRSEQAGDTSVRNAASADDHRQQKWDTQTYITEAAKEGTKHYKSSSVSVTRSSSPGTTDHDNLRVPRSAEAADTTEAVVRRIPVGCKGSAHPPSGATIAESPSTSMNCNSLDQLKTLTTPRSTSSDKCGLVPEMNSSCVRVTSAKDELAISRNSPPSVAAPPGKAVLLFGANLNAPVNKRRETPPVKNVEVKDVDVVNHTESLDRVSVDCDNAVDFSGERGTTADVQGLQKRRGRRVGTPPSVLKARDQSVNVLVLPEQHSRTPDIGNREADLPKTLQNGHDDLADSSKRAEELKVGDSQQILEHTNQGGDEPAPLKATDRLVEVKAPSVTVKTNSAIEKLKVVEETSRAASTNAQLTLKPRDQTTVHAAIPKDLDEKNEDVDAPNNLEVKERFTAAEQVQGSDEKDRIDLCAPNCLEESGGNVETLVIPASANTQESAGGDQVAVKGDSATAHKILMSDSAVITSDELEEDTKLSVPRAEDVRPVVQLKGHLETKGKSLTSQTIVGPKIRPDEIESSSVPVQLEDSASVQKDVGLPLHGSAASVSRRQIVPSHGTGPHTWRRGTAGSNVQNIATNLKASSVQGGAALVPVVQKMITPSYVRKGNSLVRASGLSNVRSTHEGKPISTFQAGQVKPVATQLHSTKRVLHRNTIVAEPSNTLTSYHAVHKKYVAPFGGSDGVLTASAVSAAAIPDVAKNRDDLGSSSTSVVLSITPAVVQKVVTLTVENSSAYTLRQKEPSSTGSLDPEKGRVIERPDDSVNEVGVTKPVNDTSSAGQVPAGTHVHGKTVRSVPSNDVVGGRLYVRRNANQLIVAPPPPAAGIVRTESQSNQTGRAMSIASHYFKRKTNQLMRKHSGKGSTQSVVQGLLGRNFPKTQHEQGDGTTIVSRKTTLEAMVGSKKGRSSWVWTLGGATVTRARDVFSPNRLGAPRLLPWKRQSSIKALKPQRLSLSRSLPEGNKRSLLFLLSKRLRKVRSVQPVYTRSADGFSLHRSGVMSLGGGNLKWTKSLEKRAKQASEEVTKAVAEAERQKREFKDVAGDAASALEDGQRALRKGMRGEGERIVWVGMERYKMDASSKTLQRIPGSQGGVGDDAANLLENSKVPPPILTPRRSIIGGTTYLRVGNGNQLVRDPKASSRALASEKVRWSLHNARFRRAKKQQYCQFFTRFGKCNKDTGKCHYIHDPDKVAVCTKFLNGSCSGDACLLTHKIIPERMPDCSYFLKGMCTNENCPYRHVSVNPKAPYCDGFLRGYCNDGDKCNKKHTYVCATYVETGECSNRASCRFHHPKQKRGASDPPIATSRKVGTKRKRRYFSVEEEPLAVKTISDAAISRPISSAADHDMTADDGSMEFISLGDSDADEDQKELGQPEPWQKSMPLVNATKEEGMMIEEVEKRIKPTFLLRMSQSATVH